MGEHDTLSTRERAAAIRDALKSKGWGRRAVGVHFEEYTTDAKIEVEVRDASIPISAVRAIASAYETVDRDKSGAILRGGNTFVTVAYEHQLLSKAAAPLMTVIALCLGLEREIVHYEGWTLTRDASDRNMWRATSPRPGDEPILAWGAMHCARRVAERVLDGVRAETPAAQVSP